VTNMLMTLALLRMPCDTVRPGRTTRPGALRSQSVESSDFSETYN